MEAFIKSSADLVVGTLGSIFPKRTDVETVIIKEVESHAKPLMAGSAFVRFGGIAGGTAVMMAAYGAHDFRIREQNAYNALCSLTWTSIDSAAKTGRRFYRLKEDKDNILKAVGSVMITGLAIFSGTCYYTAITGDKRVRKFTPYGGMLLILSWFLMLL